MQYPIVPLILPLFHLSMQCSIHQSIVPLIHPLYHLSVHCSTHPSIVPFINPLYHSSIHCTIYQSIVPFINPLYHLSVHCSTHPDVHCSINSSICIAPLIEAVFLEYARLLESLGLTRGMRYYCNLAGENGMQLLEEHFSPHKSK